MLGGLFLLLMAGALHLDNAVDYLLRSAVLWIGLLGASLAARHRKHITIEALERVLPDRLRRVTAVVIHATGLVILVVLLGVSLEYVGDSREKGEVFFTFRESGTEFREWWAKAILPVGLGLLTWRFALLLLQSVTGAEILPPEETIEESLESPAGGAAAEGAGA